MKIISIANQKGGCGKTTTAINLTSTLGFHGKKTLLIDLDPQAHATLGLNIDDSYSLYNVISKLTPRKLRIKEIIKRVDQNFDIVPSNILVGTLEQELADEIGRELKLVEIINDIKDEYDYVLIDCPPSLGFLTVNAIRASDQVIIPVETSRFSMQGVDHLTDIVNLIRDRLSHSVTERILVTMFDSRLRHSFSMLAKMKEKFGKLLYDTIVHVNVKLKESAVMGEAVLKYDKYCRGSKDYLSLARELILLDRQGTAELEPPVVKPKRAPRISVVKEEIVEATPETLAEMIAEPAPEAVSASAPETIAEAIAAAVAETTETIIESVVTPTEKYEPSERMLELVSKESSEFVALATFSLQAAGAKSVYVTGSFNDWSLDEKCRMTNADGRWTLKIDLKPGTYKYQFIVDGKWQEDPENKNTERNSFGDINSLIEVKA